MYLFMLRREVTRELKLACEQMLYLVVGSASIYALYLLLKELVLLSVTLPSISHLSQLEQIAHYVLSNALALTLGGVFLAWGMVLVFSFTKTLVVKLILRRSATT